MKSTVMPLPLIGKKMLVWYALSLSLILIVTATQVNAQTYFSDGGRVEFLSNVPLHTFTGTSDELTGRIDTNSKTVDFYVDLETLRTGNGKRDKDMWTTLETDKYPFAEFYGTLEGDFDLSKEVAQAVQVSGEFSIHGVTRQITVDGLITVVDGGLRIQADWVLSLNDYDITPPRLLILKVDDEQEVSIDIKLIQEDTTP